MSLFVSTLYMVSSAMANDKTRTCFNINVAKVLASLCPGSTPVAQLDSYRIAEGQKRHAARKARLYSITSTSAGQPNKRVWKSAAAPNWTDYPSPHPQGQPNMTSSSSSKKLWSSSETMDEQHVTGVWDFEHYSVGRSTKKAYVYA